MVNLVNVYIIHVDFAFPGDHKDAGTVVLCSIQKGRVSQDSGGGGEG